jgi:hypothetical protein
MKVWQIKACLEFEDEIFCQYFDGIDLIKNGQDNVDNSLAVEILGESKKMFYLTSHGYLRLYPEDLHLKGKGITAIKILTIKEAYAEYGGDAITEVFDYGSFNVGVGKASHS